MKLNCDLGESFGSWQMGLDALAMAHIDQANIACGFHAGDPLVMQNTLALAKKYDVSVGAHPGYPDLVGFGRRSIKCSKEEIQSLVSYQVAALDGMAKNQGMEISYVKPHGALYNDMMADEWVRKTIMQTIANYYRPLKLMLQATPELNLHREEAKQVGIELLAEAFADRCYADDGKLLSRSKEGAVLTKAAMLKQVIQLKDSGTVTSINGHVISLNPDSLCVHGDNEAGISAIKEIREIIT